MALSNIFREPRREIIEQVAGALVVLAGGGAWLVSPYLLARHWFGWEGDALIVATVFGPIVFLLFIPFVLLTHLIGEVVCDALADVGHDPRPKQRY